MPMVGHCTTEVKLHFKQLNMKHKLIKTDNYLLIVDDSEIKVGDYTYQEAANLISKFNNAYCKKIIAHLPLNNSPILEKVPLLPPFEQEDDVEKMAINEVGVDGEIYNEYDHEIFIKGYNKAKEKYRFTEEDIRKAIEMSRDIKDDSAHDVFTAEDVSGCTEVCTYGWRNRYTDDEIIQSLSQPKMPTRFECEIEFKKEESTGTDLVWGRNVLKETTNSQGQIVWVGKYIY